MVRHGGEHKSENKPRKLDELLSEGWILSMSSHPADKLLHNDLQVVEERRYEEEETLEGRSGFIGS